MIAMRSEGLEGGHDREGKLTERDSHVNGEIALDEMLKFSDVSMRFGHPVSSDTHSQCDRCCTASAL